MRIASAVIVVLVITLMAASFAQAQSCFSLVAQAGGKPGQGVSEVASGAAVPGTPGSGTDELAREVGVVNQVRSDLCPAAP